MDGGIVVKWVRRTSFLRVGQFSPSCSLAFPSQSSPAMFFARIAPIGLLLARSGSVRA